MSIKLYTDKSELFECNVSLEGASIKDSKLRAILKFDDKNLMVEGKIKSNGKGEMVNRGQKKIQSIKYTPDFVSDSFIIECKGRANESFPIRWKMFKKYVKASLPSVTLYKPQNQKECDKVVELIINKIKLNEK